MRGDVDVLSVVVVRPSHSEDDHFLFSVALVQLTNEPYAGSELLITVETHQKTLV